MSVLSDKDLMAYCEPVNIGNVERLILPGFLPPMDLRPLIEPFSHDQLKPASYDVRLGNNFIEFEPVPMGHRPAVTPMDPNSRYQMKEISVAEGDEYLMYPGQFVLAETIERVNVPDNLVGRVEGKSTLGRQGIIVHATAGYLDPGFSGKVTLEIKCHLPYPLHLVPGMNIAQFSFMNLSSPAARPYSGRYQNADGVQAAR
jgi:dCTP deaminase